MRNKIITCFIVSSAISIPLTAGAPIANAQMSEGTESPAKLVCAKNGKSKGWQHNFVVTVKGNMLSAKYENKRSISNYMGLISPSSRILVIGEGKLKEDQNSWTYSFTGHHHPVINTVLKGYLEMNSGGTGRRNCDLIFLKARQL